MTSSRPPRRIMSRTLVFTRAKRRSIPDWDSSVSSSRTVSIVVASMSVTASALISTVCTDGSAATAAMIVNQSGYIRSLSNQACIRILFGSQDYSISKILINSLCFTRSTQYCFHVYLWRRYRLDIKFLYQDLQHIGRNECRQ